MFLSSTLLTGTSIQFWIYNASVYETNCFSLAYKTLWVCLPPQLDIPSRRRECTFQGPNHVACSYPLECEVRLGFNVQRGMRAKRWTYQGCGRISKVRPRIHMAPGGGRQSWYTSWLCCGGDFSWVCMDRSRLGLAMVVAVFTAWDFEARGLEICVWCCLRRPAREGV